MIHRTTTGSTGPTDANGFSQTTTDVAQPAAVLESQSFDAAPDRYRSAGTAGGRWLATLLPQVAFAAALYAATALSSIAHAQVIHAPTIPQPVKSGDIVGVIYQNPTSNPMATHRLVTYGMEFAEDQVQPTDTLQQTYQPGGFVTPVQMDVKSTWPDGSVKMAVLTAYGVRLSSGKSRSAMLQTGGAGKAGVVRLSRLSLNMQVTLTIYASATPAVDQGASAVIGTPSGTESIDIGRQLQNALAKGQVSYWQQGFYATQGRIDVPIGGSMHLVADITSYADKTYSVDLQFRNDDAMQPTGGPMVYDVAIVNNGVTVLSQKAVSQYQYQVWHKVVWSSAGAPTINVQHDILALEKIGAVPSYSLKTGVATAAISNAPGVVGPSPFMASGLLNNDGITMGMGGTGGRCDIAFVACVDSWWLMTQDAQAAAEALGWADAAGAIPWHYWDPVRGHWISVQDYPMIWADMPPSDSSYGVILLTQRSPVDSSGSPLSGWSVETSHSPSLSYVPYLLTGSRYYLDNTIAQTLGEVAEEWPAWREGYHSFNGYPVSTDQGIIANTNDQVRNAAWGLRDLQDAAWIAPDTDPNKSYLDWLLANNYAYLSAQQQYLATVEGAPQGYLIENQTTMPTWEEDYLQTEIALEAHRGNATARAITTWAANYTVGRFLNSANGMSPWNGAGYYPPIQYPAGTYLTTWQALNDADIADPYGVAAPCTQTNGVCTNWSTYLTADYVEAAASTVATTLNAGIDATAARQALTWLYGNDPNGWLTQSFFQGYPQWDVEALGN